MKLNLGYAVVRGHIRYLSVSSVQAFDTRTPAGCERRWAFRYLFGKKEPETGPMRRGTEAAKMLENYLTQKANPAALPAFLLAGVKFLPKPGPDLVVEEPLGGKNVFGKYRIEEAVAKREAGKVIDDFPLQACGIPFVGAADFRHSRGEFVDTNGDLQEEEFSLNIEEIVDHKSTSNIAKYGKTAEYLETDVQMVGYGVCASNERPHLDRVRLSHVQYQTDGKPRAAKVTTLVPVERLRNTWDDSVVPVVRRMIDVAKVAKPEDAEPNIAACRAYNHDCPHRPYCPLTAEQLMLDLGKGDQTMGLFNKFSKENTQGVPPELPPELPPALPDEAPPLPGEEPPALPAEEAPPLPGEAPPIPSPERQAAVEAEVARLRAEDAVAAKKPDMGPKLSVLGCVKGRMYYVDCEDGHKPYLMRFVGTSEKAGGGSVFYFEDSMKAGARLEKSEHVWDVIDPVVPAVGAVPPPDAAKHNALNSAQPVSAEALAQVTDPEVRQRAEDLAKRTADAAETMKKEGGEKTSGRCTKGETKVVVSQDAMAQGQYICTCGKPFKTKDQLIKEGDVYCMTLKGHNIPKKVAEALPAQETPPTMPDEVPPLLREEPPALPFDDVTADYLRGHHDGVLSCIKTLQGLIPNG